MERPPLGPLTPVIDINEFLRRSSESEQIDIANLREEEFAATILSYLSHPAIQGEMLRQAVSQHRISADPTNAWQVRYDTLLERISAEDLSLLERDALFPEILTLLHVDQHDPNVQAAIHTVASLYLVSTSELAPQPTQTKTRTIIAKLSRALRETKKLDSDPDPSLG
ncbi:hypothetical protein CL689_00275 [Candidatus Saccharibacteria bacterium]|nr:hypothetical protein [Candidatus Saccharibacteria bacterium]MBQ68485.1 hypothetical protein [Candidatus Saccharibacteria bacterium]|tara:strand:- start:421 stop:924 length:504 start_codon:yes stop_codon:yes gene_type:complete